MSDENRKTVADIVAKMRRTKYCSDECTAVKEALEKGDSK